MPGTNISLLGQCRTHGGQPADVSHYMPRGWPGVSCGRNQVVSTLTSSSHPFTAPAALNPFHGETTVWLFLVVCFSSLSPNFHEDYSSQRLQLAAYTLAHSRSLMERFQDYRWPL